MKRARNPGNTCDMMISGLGTEFMTDQIRMELSEYTDYELFSNSIRFVFEPKRASMIN